MDKTCSVEGDRGRYFFIESVYGYPHILQTPVLSGSRSGHGDHSFLCLVPAPSWLMAAQMDAS
jgi:hypothetical protein